MFKPLPSLSDLEALSYDPETGVFRWIEPRRGTPYLAIAGSMENGYVVITLDGVDYPAHRLAWKKHYGVDPPVIIDHRNRDRSDNRIENLRLATHGQNLANAGPFVSNSSGYKGVSFNRTAGRWEARISDAGRKVALGYFDNPLQAACAYDDAALRIHGEFAYLNFALEDRPAQGLAPVRAYRMKTNTSGYRGVSRDKRNGRWAARVRSGKRHVYLGTFETAEAAAIAYDSALLALLGPTARLNFPS